MEINEIVSAIESLTLIQASELVKALEEKFGVSAARSGCRCWRCRRSGCCR